MTEEPEVLVRGSAAYHDYMRHRAGWLKSLVNGLEDYLAISGRSLLLIFLIYTTVKAGIALMHVNAPIWLEVVMLSLQVAGVEGAVPGLARHRETLVSQGRDKDARTIGRAINSTRTLAILTGLEIVLSLTPTIAGFDMAPINDAYSKVLLIARLIVISNFLIAMARMEKQGPKIISQAEHDRQQHAQEQEQIRMDNAAIQEVVNQALTHWTQQQERKLVADLHTQMEQTNQDQARLLADLQTQFAQTQQHNQTLTANLQTTNLRLADLSAKLETANLHVADLTAKWETTNVQIADLHRAVQMSAQKPPAPPAPNRSAHKITSIDQARAKHDANQGKAQRVSHTEVLSYITAHPDLKRAEVAVQLGISERKVYDALAWQKTQEHPDAATQ